MAIATFAAGCFWGVEASFQCIKGIKQTIVGYSGGHTKHPSYEQVCSDTTGHAECIQINFDPSIISYEQLLEVFWQCHDPTQLNRQGVDVGSQYRSIIFYHDEIQHKDALQSLKILKEQEIFAHPIVTEIIPATDFWRAEEYHQNYLKKRGICGTCPTNSSK